MIEDEKLGLKIAESAREKLIAETKEQNKQQILRLELSLELEKNAQKYLENLK